MYDLAIEKLYETITMTEWNEDQIAYGTSKVCEYHTQDVTMQGADETDIEGVVQVCTRKDAAAAFTRKIIFDCAPETPISRSFDLVKEVVVTTRAYSMTSNGEEHQRSQYALGESLNVLASRDDLSNPLHITFHPRYKKEGDPDMLFCELLCYLPPSPIICEIRDLPHHDLNQFFLTLQSAHDFGAILHFSTFCWRCQSSEASDCQRNFVRDLAHGLGRIVAYKRGTHTDDGPPGQTILCDVSRLILNDNELVAAAGNENDSAQLEIFKLIHFYGVARQWSDAQNWDRYVSRIKFVDPDFKLSKADVAASVERR